jgi:hypothetical protein
MFFGCNQNHYPEMAAQVPMTMVRSFKGLSDTWPVMPDGLPALLSMRPDPALLLAGKLDAQITGMLNTAPADSMLTAWHEANVDGTGLDAPTARKVHSHMLALCKRVAPQIPYGVITTMGASASWAIEGLGFYGIDLYDIHGTTDPGSTLDRMSRFPPGPRLVAETNSSDVTHRPAWFREVYEWHARHHGLAMLTFWNPTGPLSGPWVDDPATIYALRRIAADARR